MSPLTYSHSRFTLRTALYGCLALLIVLGFSAYAAYQARFLLEGPLVTISAPNTALSSDRVVTLEGDAANIARMYLNDRPVYTNESGHFSEMLVLENGYTIATIRAEDRYGRTVFVSRGFVFNPPSGEESVAQGSSEDHTTHY